MINKRGISPLLATVLLVGVVIVLALIIWFWYGEVIQGQTDKSSISAMQACAQDVDFEIKSLCKEPGSETLRFNVENKGIAIPRFRVTVTGDLGSVADDTGIGVSTATSQDITVVYSSAMGTVLEKIQITPFIVVSGEATYCEDQTKEIASIQACA